MILSVMLAYITVGPLSALVLRNIMAAINHARIRRAANHQQSASKDSAIVFLDQLSVALFSSVLFTIIDAFSLFIRMASVTSQRRQLLICYVLVLVTFIPRAAFSLVNAIGNINVV